MAQTESPSGADRIHARPSVAALALGALGIVFGDIGTSPLYAIKECFSGHYGIASSPENVLGVLSLIFWSLTFVISIQYLFFILRADNKGEGGIFSLLALATTTKGTTAKPVGAIVVLSALFGAALLYGDGVITPAISVLSAVEGLEVATSAAQPFVVPIACGILLSLFLVQRRGTGGIGRVFGPIVLVWFAAIAALGVRYVLLEPDILVAVNPVHGVRFFANNGLAGLFVLGSVVLVVTGGEALYADMGHFGKRPIRIAWLFVTFPALLASYFGQGALLLASPDRVTNPFFELVPRPLLYPMVALATAATVIASQAMISGAFSLTRQAVQLGYLPRLHIVHTSSALEGQIYIPSVSNLMMVACIAIVLTFQTSSGLAAAYGIAVTGAMTITSILFFLVVRRRWKWPLWRAVPLLTLFLAFNAGFLASTLLKVPAGGWLSLAIALAILSLMTTWRDGRAELARRIAGRKLSVDLFIQDVAKQNLHRTSGTAVFMAANPEATPVALLHHVKHNKALHEQVVFLSILTAEEPVIPTEERISFEDLGHGFYRVRAHYGFMETPSIPEILRLARAFGLEIEMGRASFFLSRESLLLTGKSKMMGWRKHIFAFISRNAQPPTAYFELPPGRVIELGIQIEI